MRKSYSHEQDGILHVDVMKLTWDIDVIEDIEGNLLCVCTLIMYIQNVKSLKCFCYFLKSFQRPFRLR